MTDELYHFGVKGMKWGVRRKRKKAEKTRERDLSYTGRQAMNFAGMSNSFRKGEKSLKARSDEEYANMFDDPELLELEGGAHKARLNQIKVYSEQADRYAKWAQDWADAHNEILNKSIDDYVSDMKFGKKVIDKILNNHPVRIG